MPATRYRNVCFTDFDVTPEHQEALKQYDKFTYVIVGVETCPTTQRQHLQGYAELNDKISLVTLRTLMPMGHIENRRGSAEEAAAYCKKEGQYWEVGEMKQQGKRNDIAHVKDLMRGGAGMEQIITNTDSYQAMAFAVKALPFFEKRRDWVPVVHWFHGPSGTGKTSTAYNDAMAKYGRVHIQNAASHWWQGYDAHEAVIIDEVRAGSAINFVALLPLLDRYPCTIECKGASRQFLAREIWLTSPFDPLTMYHRGEEEVRQLLRRISEIKLFSTCPEVARPEVAGNTRDTSGHPPAPPVPDMTPEEFELLWNIRHDS